MRAVIGGLGMIICGVVLEQQLRQGVQQFMACRFLSTAASGPCVALLMSLGDFQGGHLLVPAPAPGSTV